MKVKSLFIALFSLASYMNSAQAQTRIGSDIDGEATNDQSGWSVALSSDGTILAVGAIRNDDNGTDSGHVRVYRNNTGTWTQIGSDINGEAANDWSGGSIALSSDGNILAIGAYPNSGNGVNSGHVRVYQNNAGSWTQIGSDINGEAANDQSGTSVALSSDGSVLAIGSTFNGANGFASGHVRIFRNNSGNWTQVGTAIRGMGTNDQIGYSLALSDDGSTIAIGPRYPSGYVRVFKNIAGTWTQIGSSIYGEAINESNGYSIALSSTGDILAIGSPGNDTNGSNSGHVRVYRNNSGSWQKIGNNINGEAASDESGYSVALSSDGTILAIGARSNSGNGIYSGHVRVYRNILGTWSQIGVDINGEANNDNSGWSVALSSDGTILAIGAPNNRYYGHVRVYNFSSLLSSDSFVLKNFTVYPNPTTTVLNIELSENLELNNVIIYNTAGQLIKTEKTKKLNISDLSKGTYFVEVITDKGKAAKMIIIE